MSDPKLADALLRLTDRTDVEVFSRLNSRGGITVYVRYEREGKLRQYVVNVPPSSRCDRDARAAAIADAILSAAGTIDRQHGSS